MEDRTKGGPTFMDVANRPGNTKRTVVALRRQELGEESATPSTSVVEKAIHSVAKQCTAEDAAVQDLLGLVDSPPAAAVSVKPEMKPETLVAEQGPLEVPATRGATLDLL